MKKISFTFFAVLLILALTVKGQGTLNQRSSKDEIDEFILEQMEIFHVPGLSACIVVGDSVVWNNNYGFMNLEDSIPVHDSTLFNVFSIGKSLTSACVMQLCDDQLTSLDENINNFLPFPVTNPHNDADSISPRMLMTHTSTINDWNFNNFVVNGDPTISLADFLEDYLTPQGNYYNTDNFYNQVPGTSFHYDNYGIALTGYLIDPLTGISFHQYAKDSLLAPLDMNSSAWFLNELNIENLAIGYEYSGGNFIPKPHRGHPAYPGISFRTTALELSNFVMMLLNNGTYNNNMILSVNSIDSMTSIQNPNWSMAYGTTGLGIFQRDDYGDRVVWGHNGGSTGGYAAHYFFCKEENSGVIITTNSEQYVDPIVEYLFDYALSITNISEDPESQNLELIVYPNPTDEVININIKSDLKGEILLSIYTLSGQIIKQDPIGIIKTGKYELNCSDLLPGIYFITLQTDLGIITKKFIIE